jgi:hypothetical protein
MDLKTIEIFVSFFGKLHSITMPNRDNRDLFLGFAYTEGWRSFWKWGPNSGHVTKGKLRNTTGFYYGFS